MSIFERFLLSHRLLPPQFVRLEDDLYFMLEEMAATQNTSVPLLISDALYTLVYEGQAQAKTDYVWQTLTHREKQVAALTSLGCTNREIAERLVISVNTVRAHIRNVLEKYEATSKAELRTMLSHWDFQTWLESQPK